MYPASDLYPTSEKAETSGASNGLITLKSDSVAKMSFSADRKYGGIRCAFNGANGMEEWQYIWDDSLDVYVLGEPTYFSENVYVVGQIQSLLSNLVYQLGKLVYTPANVDMIGLPYVEKGDILYLHVKDKSIMTIVFDRTLRGIQFLRDKVVAD